MTEHEQTAGRAERDTERLAEDSERLKAEIEDVRKDWERKKDDPAVPGAAGEESQVEERRDAPEADHPTKDPPD